MRNSLASRLRSALLGAAVAALILTTTSALAGSGVGGVLNLGQLNTVDAQTSLTGNPGGSPGLKVTSTGTAAAVRGEAQNGIGINGVSVSGTGQQGQSQSGIGLYGVHTGTTGTSPGVQGQTASTDATATGVFGRVATASSAADSAGVKGLNNGNGMGVYGRNANNVPTSYGVVGEGRYGLVGTALFSGASSGVYGTAPSGFAGVEGHSDNANGYGVYGTNTSSGPGVYGTSASGTGIYGLHSSTSGAGSAVVGATNSAGGPAVLAENDSTAGGAKALVAKVPNNANGNAVAIEANNPGAGFSVIATGLAFFSRSHGGAVSAHSGDDIGVEGDGNLGVYGESSTPSSAGVGGSTSSASGAGVFGSSTTGGIGVSGESENQGLSSPGNGVQGVTFSDTASGVYGEDHGNGYGVAGRVVGASNTGTAVLGDNTSPSGWAGYFNGDVHITGTLSAGAKDFQIDDPLDPGRKYLVHTAVESPDMLDVYNGNVVTDGRGFAVVHLPRYFQALNRSFRYQLTIVGTRGWNARVIREIAHNRFTIQTDTPRVRVSWQVTGIRHDRWANAHRSPVEQAKPAGEEGAYLYPKLYGKSGAEVAFKPRVRIAVEHRSSPMLRRVLHLRAP